MLSFVANFLYYFSLVKTHLFVIDINSSITKLDFISREANLTDNFACLPGGKTRFLEGGYPADIRRIPGGYPADIRRISGLRRSPPDGFSVTSRMRAGASLSPLVGTGRRVATAGLVVPAPARRHSPPCSNQWGERCARDVTENPSGGLLRRADIRRISAGFPPDIRRVSAGYPPSRNRVLPPDCT